MQTVNGHIVPTTRDGRVIPASVFKTYQIAAPLRSHWRKVTCREYECDAYVLGWESHIDESTELGQRQAHYVRSVCGKRFREHRTEAGITVFAFEPGQEGFASRRASEDHTQHYLPLEREPLYSERGGDWRAQTSRPRGYSRAEDWVDSFATHQDKLATALERG